MAHDADPEFPREIAPSLPASLAARPWENRLEIPIPVFADRTLTRGTGYDFHTVSPRLVRAAAIARRCYLCGEPIGTDEDAWFLGDEQSFIMKYYPETIGHEDCLLASLTLCPYISTERHKRATERRLGQPQNLKDPNKPDVWVLCASREYQIAEDGLYPTERKNPRYFAYRDDRLVEVSLSQANEILETRGYETLPDH